jgi:hypothetical protein
MFKNKIIIFYTISGLQLTVLRKQRVTIRSAYYPSI